MNNKDEIDQIITQHGFNDYKWIVPRENIIISSWVRFHCQFGCKNYGKNGSCPPAVPSVEECRRMIHEYENAIILHFPIQSEDNNVHYRLMSDLVTIQPDPLEKDLILE
jgi:predicted metal-binding protein